MAVFEILTAGFFFLDEALDGNLIARRLDNYVARTDEVVETAVRHSDEADDVLYLADEAGGMSRYADEASIGTRADNLGGACTGNSFTAGTLVETEDGSKPIEEIEAGDKVLAEDPETGEQGYFEVVALTNHPTDEMLHITIEAETEVSDEASTEDTTLEVMEVTADHPVYVEEKGWIWAENLEAGDELQTAEGGWAAVVSVEHVHLDEPEQVYNFTVKGPHTYFVLEVGVLVHNCNDGVEDQSLSLANERNQLSQRWEIAGYDPDSSKIKAFIEQGYAPEDMLVLYRGQGTIRRGSILSQAARAGGIEYSHEMFDGGLASWLKARDGRRFLSSHGIDYYELPDDDFLRILEVHRSLAYEDLGRSPFISTSKTLEVARFQFAQPGEHVIEILIPKNMVVDDLSNVRLGMPEGTAFDSVKLTGRNPHREDEFSMLHQIPNEYIIRYKKLGLFSWEDDPWQAYPH